MNSESGPSGSRTGTTSSTTESDALLSPRQREKSKAITLDDIVFDENKVDRDLSLLISQYLHTRPHPGLARTFDEEVLELDAGDSVWKMSKRSSGPSWVRLELGFGACLTVDGEYGMLEGLVGRPGLLKPQSQRAFLYMCYRQQFLEHIENREIQKAFNLLQKRLKPLEHYQPVPYDFYNLCYLTSAGTVHDAPGLKDWGGVGPEREKLVGMWKELTEFVSLNEDGLGERENIKPGRLVHLVKQAAAWQVGNVGNRGSKPYLIKSLLYDYAVRSVPDRVRLQIRGHSANVKCVDFIGEEEPWAISGSSDSTLRIFSTTDGSVKHILTGHRSRVWDCASSTSGQLVASASGDGTVRVWSAETGSCESVLDAGSGDAYCVRWRPNGEEQLVSASYDKIIRVWDVERGTQIRTFSGHSQSTLSVAYDHTGNLLASGAKDKHVRLWDAIAGMCVKTMPGSLGEISSVSFDSDGKYLLAGCKDNSNRLWDLRMQRILYRYTGHQNTSKNLIRCGFGGHDSSLIISGSEDGNVYLWEREPTAEPAREVSTAPSSVASPTSLSQGAISRSSSLRVPRTAPLTTSPSSVNRSSPAYYPPKTHKPVAHSAYGGAGINVRPKKILEGRADGAVFDVRWRGGEIVSAGEDGTVAIWSSEHEEEA